MMIKREIRKWRLEIGTTLILIAMLAGNLFADPVITGNFALVDYTYTGLDTVSPGAQGIHLMTLHVNNPNAPGSVSYRITGINLTSLKDMNVYVDRLYISDQGIIIGQAMITNSITSVIVPFDDVIAPLQTEQYEIYADLKSNASAGTYSLQIQTSSDILMERELDPGYTVLAESSGKDFPFCSDTFSVIAASWTESFYNFPNPFNPKTGSTTIQYFLHGKTDVSVKIFDVSGKLVKTLVEESMHDANILYKVKWDGKTESGSEVISGVYYGVIDMGDAKFNTKIVVVK